MVRAKPPYLVIPIIGIGLNPRILLLIRLRRRRIRLAAE